MGFLVLSTIVNGYSVSILRSRVTEAVALYVVVLFSAGFLLAQTLPDAPRIQVQHQCQSQGKNKKKNKDGDKDEAATSDSNSSHQPTPPSNNSSQGEQTKRMMWVVPNFAAVSAGKQLPPLSTSEKFKLAEDDSFDYSAFVWTGILAFQSWALNSDPELGRGFAGYGRYYWRGFADGVSGTFFTEAIVPSITHEDPRYYTMGHGGFWRRTGYALSRTFITKTDSRSTTFNWSEVGGNVLEAGLSNAYYPPQERGVNQTLRNWGTQMESAALNNVAKEFWPDIRHKLLRQK
jgi:hypothetical protein